ncbi:MAG: hypothetical protein J6M05_01410 [Cardiobacteriaceae bacterium]|nr:hypothetical protein [Cardiobacteriaceae bacterium]
MTDKSEGKYYCQICGFECDESDLCSFELCICCGGEFGYDDDDDDAIRTYREKWFGDGIPICFTKNPRFPKYWSIAHLKTQLANIGFNLTDEMIAEIEKNRMKR